MADKKQTEANPANSQFAVTVYQENIITKIMDRFRPPGEVQRFLDELHPGAKIIDVLHNDEEY